MSYDLLRGLHVGAVVVWMAGFAVLPRLYLLHLEVGAGSPLAARLERMERQALRLIVNPAMIAAFVFGGWLIWIDGHELRGWGFLAQPWMLVKLAGIAAMTWHHHVLARARKRLARGESAKSAGYWRLMGDAPLALAAIMALAVTTEFGA